MGTMVTIVLVVAALILGLVLVRKIMCAGLLITEDITKEVEGQIKGLFGTAEYGVKCVGEGGKEIKIGADGGSKRLGCVIITDTAGSYDFDIIDIKSLSGVRTEEVNRWVLSEGRSDVKVSPGSTTVNILTIKPPQKVSATTVEVEVEVRDQNLDSVETHYMQFDISPVGVIAAGLC